MVISIDHGNKQIKAAHKTFVSGLQETAVRPAPGDSFHGTRAPTTPPQTTGWPASCSLRCPVQAL